MADTLDFPFDEVAENALHLVKQGHTIFQKFSCEKCGVRQHMEEPNKFYKTGKCETCGHVTDLTRTGCNFLLCISAGAEDGKGLMDKILGGRP